ncbi:hypothetical protein G9463_02615 [Haloarcula sp. JP-Z28]|uniref:hypothetical protein n=1 Tax=Haloarcula sp. JP-Z28 TaxID=2716715 RepID=UPI001404E14D|nr:hypothetical protein [Haloarcula sp. JP-Z28]NHN62206.1 hypothetical protein [Haloarcula sp. JP-Z28]
MDIIQYLDELEPVGMVLIGLVLFIIPEPATSTLGISLIVLGGAWWFYEWNR